MRKMGMMGHVVLVVAGTVAAGLGFADVRPPAMDVLPLGSVRPSGFLRTQLDLQAQGLTGHAEELYDDIGKSDWLTGGHVGSQYSWERGPYYAKGLVALALTLDDPGLKARAKRWVDAILASQRPNGDFGPRNRNWWANMVALYLLRDWAVATGDARVVPFLARYFAFQADELPKHGLEKDSCWAVARGGDNLEVVLWLYDRTKDEKLLTLAQTLVEQTADWTDYFRGPMNRDEKWKAEANRGYQRHIVNVMQALKYPALRWRLTGEAADLRAPLDVFRPGSWIWTMCGRVDGMVNGSEPLTGSGTTEGTELCAVAERILSDQIACSISGDAAYGDRLESVAYNTLSGMLSPDGRGMRYYSLLNQPACEDKFLGKWNNAKSVREKGHQGPSHVPGPHAGYGCCRSNFHFAWPKFVQSMWMRRGKGLAAVAYGPCTLRTDVGGVGVRIAEKTDYPFHLSRKTVFEIEEGGGSFPISFRIPNWSVATKVSVAGEDWKAPAEAGSFVTIDRTWKKGDCVALAFTPVVETVRGFHESVAIRRGPLVYSFAPALRLQEMPEFSEKGFPTTELIPTEPWNWALVLGTDGKVDARVIEAPDALPSQPFSPAASTDAILVPAVRTSVGGWGTMQAAVPGRAVEPPRSPIETAAGRTETLRLVPTGASQLRITLFPWTVIK